MIDQKRAQFIPDDAIKAEIEGQEDTVETLASTEPFAETVKLDEKELKENRLQAERSRIRDNEEANSIRRSLGISEVSIDTSGASSELRRQQLLEKYKQELERISPTGKVLNFERDGSVAEQEIDLDQLVFVRADSYAPKQTESGLVIETAYDATNGEIERLTNHFTLNHKVVQNSGGEWNNTPYLFVSPARSMVEANGEPENLYAIDSFYTKSVSLPKGSVIIHEKGQKPNIGNRENDYILIERDENTADKEILSLVLEKMGYTEIVGSDHSAAPDYRNFDKAVARYATEHDMDSMVHREAWSNIWEECRQYIKVENQDAALKHFLYMLGKNSKESQRMPNQLKADLFKDIFTIFEKPGNDQAKESIRSAIERIIDSEDYVDKNLIIASVPDSAWKFIYDSMASKIGGFEGYADEAEVKQVFQSIYNSAYKEASGKDIAFGNE